MPTIPTPRSSAPVSWHQESLLPPDVLQITVKLGVVSSGDHIQAQLEAREADGTLVALWSVHHRRLGQLPAVLDLVRAEVEKLVHPF